MKLTALLLLLLTGCIGKHLHQCTPNVNCPPCGGSPIGSRDLELCGALK